MWWTKLVFGDRSTRALIVTRCCYDLDFDTAFLTNPEQSSVLIDVVVSGLQLNRLSLYFVI